MHWLHLGLKEPEGLSLDWIGRNLYIVDAGLRAIVTCPLFGGMCAVIIDKNIHKPRDIVVDPVRG